jgi:hypothetical protein
MKPRKNRLEYRQENWPSFVFMHVIFFLVQLFFFWIFFGEAWFSAYIPVIYYRIQQIGYPTVLICSLIWLNRTLYPGEAKYMLVSIGMFLLEWFGIDRLIVH